MPVLARVEAVHDDEDSGDTAFVCPVVGCTVTTAHVVYCYTIAYDCWQMALGLGRASTQSTRVEYSQMPRGARRESQGDRVDAVKYVCAVVPQHQADCTI